MGSNNSKQKENLKENLSDEQLLVLDYVPVPQQVDVRIEEAATISKDAVTMNESFELARIIYQDVLSPQLQENESLKRKHKEDLMRELFGILKVQFKFTYIFVLMLIFVTISSSFLCISDVIVKNIFTFIEFYITSIVVELLSILFFIVKSVFDKSIVDLIKDFDKREQKNAEKENRK